MITVAVVLLSAVASNIASAQSAADSAAILADLAMKAYTERTPDALERAFTLWARARAILRSQGDRAGEATTLNFMGLVHSGLGRADSALAYYGQALPIRRAVGDRAGEASTLHNIGHVYSGLGRADSALGYYAQALEIDRARGNRVGEAATLNNIGYVHSGLRRADSARSYYGQALLIQRAVGDRAGEATTLNNLAAVQLMVGRADSALASYAAALRIQRALGDLASEVKTLASIGLVQSSLGRADSALAYYAEALRIDDAAEGDLGTARTLYYFGDLHSRVARAHSRAGRADSALTYYAQALLSQRAVGDRAEVAATLNNIGLAQSTLGRPDSALSYYAQALRIQRAMGRRAGEAATLNNMANVHLLLGRADSALTYYAQALAIRRGEADRAAEATTLNNIGAVHTSLGRADSALAYFAEGLAIARAAGRRENEATALSNIGAALSDLGRPDSALSYYARSLPITRALGDRAGEATTLSNIGNVHASLARADSALAYFAQALAIQRTVGDRRGEAATLSNIGGVHSRLGPASSALAYYAQALPIQRAVDDRAGEANTLSIMGWMQQRLGRHSSAVAYYDSAAAAYASISQHTGGDDNRLTFGERQVALFDLWSLAWLVREAELGGGARAAALAAAERGRAQALLELMRSTAARGGGAVGTSRDVARPGADLAQEGVRLAESVTRDGATGLSYMVTADTLITWLLLPSGEIHVFRTPVTDTTLGSTVAALRRGLGADSAAVRDRMALRDGPTLEATRDLTSAAQRADAGAFQEASAQLAEWLFPLGLVERLPKGGELVIVPHGPLNLVPFAALKADSSGAPLGVRYSIRYSPSLSTLAEIADRGTAMTAAEARRSALIVGDPEMPMVTTFRGERVKLGQLPGAREESRWVASQAGGQVVTDGEASETFVRSQLRTATLVHLATHGYAYASEALARRSFVALAPDQANDGLLTVGEILDDIGSITAELVVLSACQTGLGDLKQAEGTVGLQRAFLAKGARSVLVSLWSVSDDATDLLMRSFYGKWLGGATKAEALRGAQEEVRGEPGSRFHDPRYWAAFQLVGAR